MSNASASGEQASLPGVFIKANIRFKLFDREYTFTGQPISSFGISGLRWTAFDPVEQVGQNVVVRCELLNQDRFKFITTGTVIAESTTEAQYLGIRIHPAAADAKKLAAIIAEEGYYPTEYVRKYPRIPATGRLKDMPLRCLMQAEGEDLIVFDLVNLSPNGILLHTENPNAGFLVAGNRIQARAEPRGTLFQAFSFEGVICRVMQERNAESGNVDYYLGIRFTRLAESDKENFLEVLRAVLQEIPNSGLIR